MILSRLGRIEKAMDEATCYEEWRAAAMEHDDASGASQWKEMDRSRRYDHVSMSS